jgi:hypothetical protein
MLKATPHQAIVAHINIKLINERRCYALPVIPHRSRPPLQATARHRDVRPSMRTRRLSYHTERNTTPHHTRRCGGRVRGQKRIASLSTNIVPLRSRVAASVRHEPSCHLKVTESACQQKRRGTFLNGTQSSHCTYYTQAEQMKAAVAMTSANRRRTWSRSDRASRPASVTSQRATSR